jgi:hypothetical protein
VLFPSSRFLLKRAPVFPLLAVLGCASGQPHVQAGAPSAEARPVKQTANLSALEAELVARHGEAQRARIERGVEQVAVLWREEDGDLASFAREYFIADDKQLDATLARLEAAFEQLDGHMNEIGRELRRPTDLDLGPLLPVDPLLAAYDPSAHTTEDLFQSKVGFVALLNFPLTTLAERMEKGPGYTRRQWAEARLTGRFNRRVPAEVRQASARAGAAADLYIAEYNVWMHHLGTARDTGPSPRGCG